MLYCVKWQAMKPCCFQSHFSQNITEPVSWPEGSRNREEAVRLSAELLFSFAMDRYARVLHNEGWPIFFVQGGVR